MTQIHFDLVNRQADKDDQPENMLEFRNILNEVETVELSEFIGPSGEDDSNASDDDFENDKAYQQEFDEQELEDIEYLADNQGPDPEDLNLDNEQQDDYFQHPDTAMDEMSESANSIESPIPPLNLDEYS